MHRCSGIKPDGGRCERIVSSEQEYCYSHDPSRQAERRRNAARGGKAKANQDLADVKQRLRALAEGVLAGDVDKGVGAVVATIWGVYLRAVSTELAVRERLELLERLEALEQSVESRRGGNRWRGA
jgi:hypothetical protein